MRTGTAKVGRALLVAFLAVGAGASAAEPTGVALEIERVASAKPAEAQAWLDASVADVAANVQAIADLDRSLRRKGKGDGEGLPCVTDALGAARVLHDVAVSAAKVANAAVAAADQARARYEVRKVAIAVRQTRELRAEAEKCAVGEGIQPGVTRLEVDGDLGDPAADLAESPDDLLDYGFDPTQSSPF